MRSPPHHTLLAFPFGMPRAVLHRVRLSWRALRPGTVGFPLRASVVLQPRALACCAPARTRMVGCERATCRGHASRRIVSRQCNPKRGNPAGGLLTSCHSILSRALHAWCTDEAFCPPVAMGGLAPTPPPAPAPDRHRSALPVPQGVPRRAAEDRQEGGGSRTVVTHATTHHPLLRPHARAVLEQRGFQHGEQRLGGRRVLGQVRAGTPLASPCALTPHPFAFAYVPTRRRAQAADRQLRVRTGASPGHVKAGGGGVVHACHPACARHRGAGTTT
jgi:hypothetical protein